ncbi:MAG: hypothetical protein CMC96_04565 [Flavobacteriales bacterium]|nr:hypothetical protein [Flavobacteriales bacterium]
MTTTKLLKTLEKRIEFKDKLISTFKVEEDKPQVIKIGNSKSLIDSILEVDSKCHKVDINAQIKDIHLKKMLEAEKAEFEIFNISDEYILKNNQSDLLIGETTYTAKSDLLDYYSFSKFANYCRDKDFSDLIDTIKEYLFSKNSANTDQKSLRLVHKFEDDKYYIRALTSTNGYQDFGINFSVFVALVALADYVEKSNNEIYINKYKVDDSHIYVSFALRNEFKVNEKITLSFNLVLENDEIKRNAVSFNGIFKLRWEESDKKSEIYLKPTGVKKEDKNHPVDLLTYQHRGNVQGVFDKIQKLPDLIDFFISQVSEDAKRISRISHPDDIRKFIRDKVKNSRKAEFQTYKKDILNKLMSVSVTNTFKLFELLREVEDLFEHDDIVSINFWRTKLYESLIEKK